MWPVIGRLTFDRPLQPPIKQAGGAPLEKEPCPPWSKVRVLCCPANNYRPETKEALAKHAPSADIIDVTGDSQGYWHAIRDRWTSSDDLVIVEQDIAFTAEQLQSFEDCPQPLCTFGYWHYIKKDGPLPPDDATLDNGIGFIRFRKELMARIPVSQISCNHDGSIHWANLDSRLIHTSRRFGFSPHKHGRVDHYHYE